MKRSFGLGIYIRMALLNALTLLMLLSFGQAASLPTVQTYISTQKTRDNNAKSIIVGYPTRIVLPSVGIDLEVARGSYNPSNGSWTLDNTKAFYADTSEPVNDSNGTTLIYGHAQAPIFADLNKLASNASAAVYSDSNYVFRYKYEFVKEVVPTDTSVFAENGAPALVLQTCSGPWDSYRALYRFKLEEVVKT